MDTDGFHARILNSSEPVVTRWDNSPPELSERPVGTWDVTPTANGVQAEQTGRSVVPEGVKAELKRQAQETGERAASTETLRYQHDLDSGETDYRAPRRSVSELAAALQARRNQQGGGDQELNARYKRVADLLSQQAQERRAAQNQRPRRGRSSNAGDKERGYKLPQIVVVQEPMNSRRMGGL